MGVQPEDVKLLPFQDSWFIKRSHDHAGALRATEFAPMAANASWSSGLFMIDSRKVMEIMVLSNVAGHLYVHIGTNPVRILAEANSNSWISYPYVALNVSNTFRIPCRSEIARVDYVNGATEQATWEISILLKNA